VAIIGKSNTGKSTLFELLEGLFGKLSEKSSQSSAAGIRQVIRRSAKVVLCDEFESGKHRADILEMLRASGRGDKVLRGSSGHKGQQFTLRHICWVAAIESGLKREPDRNRFITLELIPPTEEMAGKLKLPPAPELNELGQSLLAVSIRYGLQARSLAVELKGMRFEGVHQRVIESYAVPAAIVATMLGRAGEEAAQIMSRMLNTVDKTETGMSDEESLLTDILGSVVHMERGAQATVSQIINSRKIDLDAEHTLERVGIGIFEGEHWHKDGEMIKGDYLFIAHSLVARQLLQRTQWETQNIDQILSRIAGSVKLKKRIAGMHPWGIMIPLKTACEAVANIDQVCQLTTF
jgi:hypothetical protein